jgi:hypothetical protein
MTDEDRTSAAPAQQQQQQQEQPFRFLTNEEFEALPRDEKMPYIRRAIAALQAWQMKLPPAN